MPNNSIVVGWVPLSFFDNLKLLTHGLEGINVIAMITVHGYKDNICKLVGYVFLPVFRFESQHSQQFFCFFSQMQSLAGAAVVFTKCPVGPDVEFVK